MPKTKVNNIQLYYELHGKGVPLLLIAGLGCDSQSWHPIISELSEHFQTIIFDNRGVGRSDIPKLPYSIRDMADDTLKLLDYLNVRATNIIGCSMGGYIAQEFAIRYPERVSKLILGSTAPLSSTRNNLLFENLLKWRLDRIDLESWMWAWSFWLFTPQRFEDRSFIDAYIKDALEYPYPQSINAFKGQIEAICTHNARGGLKKIQAETLVIEGKEDILILPGETELLTKEIPKCSSLVVEDAAHSVYMEKPKAFIRAVLDFLS